MEIKLSPEQERIINQFLDSKQFESKEEVLSASLLALEEWEKGYSELKGMIQSGLDQYERGEFSGLDMDAIKRKAREKLVEQKVHEAKQEEATEWTDEDWAFIRTEGKQRVLDQKIREGINTRSIPVEEGHWERLRKRLNRMADERL